MNKYISEELYDELCATLTDFENSNSGREDYSSGYISDGEWLDVFYDLCVKMQNELGK